MQQVDQRVPLVGPIVDRRDHVGQVLSRCAEVHLLHFDAELLPHQLRDVAFDLQRGRGREQADQWSPASRVDSGDRSSTHDNKASREG